MYKKILCVCICNTCRSPLAGAVMSRQFAQAGLDIEVHSAGLWSAYEGYPADSRGVVAARLRGFDLSKHVVRKVSIDDFGTYDLILAMDQTSLTELELKRPACNTTRIQLFTSCSEVYHGQDVPDPYPTGQFDPVIDIIEETTRHGTARIQSSRQLLCA